MTDLAEIDAEEFEERHRYLSVLAKSADYGTREGAEQQLAALNRLAAAGVVKVGPKGYVHGWIYVGPQAAGGRVLHQDFGHGTVRRKDDTHVHVLFDSGKMRSFQHGKGGKAGEHFVRRADHEAAGGKPTAHAKDELARGKDEAARGKDEAVRAERPARAAASHAKPDPEEERQARISALEQHLARGKEEAQGRRRARIAEREAGAGKKPAGRRGPLSDKEFEDRQKYVEDTIGEARKSHATDITHSKDGVWDPERDKMHREIADHLYAKAAHVPNNGEAVVAGGLGGAGKTTILTRHAGIDPKNYLTVNPDDIKEELAKRGMVPDVPGHPDLSPMERSALVHEESSRIAQLLADKAYQDKKNMIWDITMSSGGSVQSRLDKLKKHGYGNVKGVFVDIPAETSVERALDRYRRGVDDFHAGKGFGGRYVPPSVIRAQKTSGGRTINRQVFDGLRDQFDDWQVYDNSGDFNPQLVEAKGKVKSWRP